MRYLRLPEHSGEFVRLKGGYSKYHKWCEDNLDVRRTWVMGGNKDEQGSCLVRTPRQKEVKVNRNDRCPCGSGKKYKKCCM